MISNAKIISHRNVVFLDRWLFNKSKKYKKEKVQYIKIHYFVPCETNYVI